jgi:hypothetical protein
VPTHVLAVRSSISAADREVLRKALEALNEGDNQTLRDKLFTSKLVAVDSRNTSRACARRSPS